MILQHNYEPVTRSSSLETAQASIEMTPEMFKLLSSGLYQYKERAVIRELSCNGLDGHAMAGKKDVPLDIHLPTRFEPYFEVRDYGISMNHETVMKMYLSYGASTKRDTNDAIGCFGVGSKSFFSVAQSATVTAWMDGVKRQYTIYMEEGMPQVTKLMEMPSDEPTGFSVRVAIPNTMIGTFFQEACYVYSFFDVKPNCNIELDYYHSGYELALEGEKYKAYTYHRKSSWAEPDIKIVMGGVAYDFELDTIFAERQELWELIDENLFKEYKLIEIHLPIGSVEVAASRETLSFTEETYAYIVNVIKEFAQSVIKDLQSQVDGCNTFAELAELRNDWKNCYEKKTLVYIDKSLVFRGKTVADWVHIFTYRHVEFRKNKLGKRFPMRNYRGDEVWDDYGKVVYAHDVIDLGMRKIELRELEGKKPTLSPVVDKHSYTPFSWYWKENTFDTNIFVINNRTTKSGTIKTTGNMQIMKAIAQGFSTEKSVSNPTVWTFPSQKSLLDFFKGIGIPRERVLKNTFLLADHEDLYKPVRRVAPPVKMVVIEEDTKYEDNICINDVKGQQYYIRTVGNEVISCGISICNDSIMSLARILGGKIYVFRKSNWIKIPEDWIEVTDEVIAENLFKDPYQLYRLSMRLTKNMVRGYYPSYDSLRMILSWGGKFKSPWIPYRRQEEFSHMEDNIHVIEKYLGRFHYVAMSDNLFEDTQSDIYNVAENVLTYNHPAKAHYHAIKNKLKKKIQKDTDKFKERNFLYSLIDWYKVSFKEVVEKDGGITMKGLSAEAIKKCVY